MNQNQCCCWMGLGWEEYAVLGVDTTKIGNSFTTIFERITWFFKKHSLTGRMTSVTFWLSANSSWILFIQSKNTLTDVNVSWAEHPSASPTTFVKIPYIKAILVLLKKFTHSLVSTLDSKYTCRKNVCGKDPPPSLKTNPVPLSSGESRVPVKCVWEWTQLREHNNHSCLCTLTCVMDSTKFGYCWFPGTISQALPLFGNW